MKVSQGRQRRVLFFAFMHMFLIDETNLNYRADRFFILGGLVITVDQISRVDQAVKERRQEFGYRNGDSFKFNTHSRPPHVSVESAKDAKRAIIEDLKNIGVRLIITVVLHQISANKGERLLEWGLSNVAASYHRLLEEEAAKGFMFMDRDSDRFKFFSEFHQHGFNYEDRVKSVQDRILLFGMTNDRASHLASATDIALGAFRYCVNTASGEGRSEIAKGMFKNLAQLLWAREDESGVLHAKGYGYIPSPNPECIKVPQYRMRYEQLAKALESYALDEIVE